MTRFEPLFSYAKRSARHLDGRQLSCELCAAPVAEAHRHAVDLGDQRLLCICHACALLFASPDIATGRYRSVPDRIVADPAFSMSEEMWSSLEIPVRFAFVFHSSRRGRWIAMYPSPAGATESQLELGAWAPIVDASPLIASVVPDVEALLVYGARAGEALTCMVVPIDICYELAAQVRRTWKGFSGGDAPTEIEASLQKLRERARPLVPEDPDDRH
ncbi:MAG TPA: DUF5947 family protein [Kofleriaceae bacterium]|nr:DUF5947 family protein [Kofleriaceae bacterium]